MRILVTGGAGYIGAITTELLCKEGFETVVFDNLHQGHKENVKGLFVIGDILNKEDFKKLEGKFDAVIHFAALTLTGESMRNPGKYFEVNVMGGVNLLEFMGEKKIKKIVFSSSCSIYGTPKSLPVKEDDEKNADSPYGESKFMFERILHWYDKIHKIKYINLRYFNAAGATLDGSLGEDHNPETHIIPNAIKAILNNKEFELYGNDYPTQDGTAVRDYIHVLDLAKAHMLALKKLDEGKSDNFNLGTGKGYSNLEVLEMVRKVSGKDLKVKVCPRRPGDPPEMFANNSKAKRELGFKPEYSDLETIISTAYKWHSK